MKRQNSLNVTWAKASGEVYCHHASINIPFKASLFPPEIVYVGVTVRTNIIQKKKIVKSFDKRISRFLPCKVEDDILVIPINSASIIEGLSLNSWTSLKHKGRGTPKEIPINVFYKVEEDPEVSLTFDYKNGKTPYLIGEPDFINLKDGDKIDSLITFPS